MIKAKKHTNILRIRAAITSPRGGLAGGEGDNDHFPIYLNTRSYKTSEGDRDRDRARERENKRKKEK